MRAFLSLHLIFFALCFLGCDKSQKMMMPVVVDEEPEQVAIEPTHVKRHTLEGMASVGLGSTWFDIVDGRVPENQMFNIGWKGNPIWKDGEWLVLLLIADFHESINRTSGIAAPAIPIHFADIWVDPRPVNEEHYQYITALLDIPIEVLLSGPSDKLQEPTDEWIISLLNKDFTDVVKISPDGIATAFSYVEE